MTFIMRFVCVAAAYTAVLSLVGNPGIGAVTTGCFFSLIFCSAFTVVENLITRREFVAFVTTNVLLIGLDTFVQLETAKTGKFSSYLGDTARWIEGYPTTFGIVGMIEFATLCVFCNALGVATYWGLKRLLSRAMRSTASNLNNTE